MNVLCVEADKTKLMQMWRDTRKLVPHASITVCRDPYKAEAEAKTKGCDVLLTGTVFDGFSLDGCMLAEQVLLVNPHVNIIFIADRVDNFEAYDAWKIGASAFLLRSYEKKRLAKALNNPRFVTE